MGVSRAIKQFGSTEWVASVAQTLRHLIRSSIVGGSPALFLSLQIYTRWLQVPSVIMCQLAVWHIYSLLKLSGTGCSYHTMKHAVHLPRTSISADRVCYFHPFFLNLICWGISLEQNCVPFILSARALYACTTFFTALFMKETLLHMHSYPTITFQTLFDSFTIHCTNVFFTIKSKTWYNRSCYNYCYDKHE